MKDKEKSNKSQKFANFLAFRLSFSYGVMDFTKSSLDRITTMSSNQNKKTYIQPKLSILGSMEKLTLQPSWTYSYSHSSSYSEAGGNRHGHHEIS